LFGDLQSREHEHYYNSQGSKRPRKLDLVWIAGPATSARALLQALVIQDEALDDELAEGLRGPDAELRGLVAVDAVADRDDRGNLDPEELRERPLREPCGLVTELDADLHHPVGRGVQQKLGLAGEIGHGASGGLGYPEGDGEDPGAKRRAAKHDVRAAGLEPARG
jgi:hypothetical protein